MTEPAERELADTPDPSLRPIHYLGNKSKILGEIAHTIGELVGPGAVVCDLFAGSGVVARRLAREHVVVAADVQEYARVVTQALLAPRGLPDPLRDALLSSARSQSERIATGGMGALLELEAAVLARAATGDVAQLCELVEHGALINAPPSSSVNRDDLHVLLRRARSSVPASPNSVMTRYYGGVYYSYEQATALDGLASAVRALPLQYRDVALAALLSTASDLVSSVGNQFAQPMKLRAPDGSPKAGLIAAAVRARSRPVLQTFSRWLDRYASLPLRPGHHRVYRGDFRSVLATLTPDVSAIYADPPYTRDHYSRFYHVLETLALGDEPGVSTMSAGGTVRPSRALYRLHRHQSPFSIKRQVTPAFQELFASSARLGASVVLSYSPRSPGTPSRAETRLLTLEQLVGLARDHFSLVELQGTGRAAHSKLNAARLNALAGDGETEVLLVARP